MSRYSHLIALLLLTVSSSLGQEACTDDLSPHPDCTKYFQCVHGAKVARDCGPGTHFNPTMKVCDFPGNAGCMGGAAPAGPTFSGDPVGPSWSGGPAGAWAPQGPVGDVLQPAPETSQQQEYMDFDVRINGGVFGPQTGQGECSAHPHMDVLLPHADCAKFYQCVNGQKVERSCAAGTHFNPAAGICDWPANAGCVGSQQVPDLESRLPEIEEETPPSSEEETPYFEKPDTPSSGETDTTSPDQNTPSSEETGTPSPSENTPSSKEPDTSSPDENTPSSEKPENTSEPEPETSSTEEKVPDCKDPSVCASYWPDKSDCSKYFKCQNSEPISESCPEGLSFNPKIKMCDFPKNVKCDQGDGVESESDSDFDAWSSEDNLPGNSQENLPIVPTDSAEGGVYIEYSIDTATEFGGSLEDSDNNSKEPGLPANSNESDYEYDSSIEEIVELNDSNELKVSEDDVSSEITQPEMPKLSYEKISIESSDEYEINSKSKTIGASNEHIINASKEYDEIEEPKSPELSNELHLTNEFLHPTSSIEKSNEDRSGKTSSEDEEADKTEGRICPVGFFGQIPHPIECDTFYMCSFGVSVQLYCPNGQEYNSELSRCVVISENGCNATKAL